MRDEFGAGPDNLVEQILDGGQSAVGIESTILDLSRMATQGPILLRPGHISAADIAAVIGVLPHAADQAAPRASGTLEAHYAPHTPVALVASERLPLVLQQLARAQRSVALIHRTAQTFSPVAAHCMLPDAPEDYAHDLYAALRSMDAANADLILVEEPPDVDAWQGINDRLRRAAHGSVGTLESLL